MPDNVKIRPEGFQVCFAAPVYTRWFANGQWGGQAKAKAAAFDHAETIRALRGRPRDILTTAMKNNLSTGIAGITRSISERKGNYYIRYQVLHKYEYGKRKIKVFQAGNVETTSHAKDMHTFRKAKKFRRDYEVRMTV